MSDGWWLIIAPLPKGTHVIYWDVKGINPSGGGTFDQWASYRVLFR
jgi:hypothetical protein